MDRQAAGDAARAALEREGVGDADEAFDLASVDVVTRWVDVVTRWVVARAIETEAKRTLPDAGVAGAGTLGELLDLAEKDRA